MLCKESGSNDWTMHIEARLFALLTAVSATAQPLTWYIQGLIFNSLEPMGMRGLQPFWFELSTLC